MSIKYFKGTFGEMAERCVKGAGTNAERTARIVTLLCELQDFHIKSHDETRAELAKAEARAEKAEAENERLVDDMKDQLCDVDKDILINDLESRVAELEKAIYSALENATDTIWVSEIGTLQDFMGKEQSK